MAEQRKLTFKDFLEEAIPRLLDVVGAEKTKAIADETALRMGDGGSTKEWMECWGAVVRDDGNPVAMMAMVEAVQAMGRRT